MSKSNQKAILLLSRYNMRAIIAICRTLIKYHINFFIFAHGKDDPIFLTAYQKYVFCKLENPQLDINELNKSFVLIKEKYQIQELYFLCTSEYLNRFLLKNESLFSDIIIPLVDIDLYSKISDKKSFIEICINSKIKVPQ
jgi:hypothetical protein